MMRNSIVNKVLTAFFIIMTVSFLSLALIISMYHKKFTLEDKLNQLESQAEIISKSAIDYVSNPNNNYSIDYLSEEIKNISKSKVDYKIKKAYD